MGTNGGKELILKERISVVSGCEGLEAGDQDKLIKPGLLIARYLRMELAMNQVYVKQK